MRSQLVAMTCLLLASAAACSGRPTHPAAGAPSSPCDEAVPQCLPTARASFIPVPAVAIGKPFKYQVPSDNGAVDLEITVTSIRTRPGTDEEDGHTTVCVGGRLRNTGSTAVEGATTDAAWFGLDDQQAEVQPGTMGECGSRGRVWAGIDQPAPLPGKYVTGVWMYSVPDKPGAIEVTDTDGHPLYRIDYGPKSAQVRINAVGQ
jgi:hypothetical protein